MIVRRIERRDIFLSWGYDAYFENITYSCEAYVYHYAVCLLIFRWIGRTVRLACAALILLLATHAESSASTLHPSGFETVLHASTHAGFSFTDEKLVNGVPFDGRNKYSLISKAMFANNSTSHTGAVSTPADETAGGESPARPTAADNRIPDWRGIGRDTGIIIGGQLAAVGITYVMPESFSSWTPEQKKAGAKKYKNNVAHPVMDKDEFYINYLLHPYWGATYYTRARERGLDTVSSFGYSVMMSALYEFGVEAIAERPSIQDLIATPVLGSLLGALIEPWRDSIKSKQELLWYDHAALILTDPLGVVSLGFEKMFGIKSTIIVDYSVPQRQNRSTGSAVASNSSRIGVVLQFPLN